MAEKRKILEMLSEGIINVDEAYSLLEAIKEQEPKRFYTTDEKEKIRSAKKKLDGVMEDIDKTLSNLGNEVSMVVKKSLRMAGIKLEKVTKEDQENE